MSDTETNPLLLLFFYILFVKVFRKSIVSQTVIQGRQTRIFILSENIRNIQDFNTDTNATALQRSRIKKLVSNTDLESYPVIKLSYYYEEILKNRNKIQKRTSGTDHIYTYENISCNDTILSGSATITCVGDGRVVEKDTNVKCAAMNEVTVENVVSDDGHKENDVECQICFEKIELTEDIRLISCNHLFHTQCIDTWLTTRSSFCPICRHDLRLTISEEGGSTNLNNNQNMRWEASVIDFSGLSGRGTFDVPGGRQ
ncbi:hypothetical protein BB559_004935 [Furculomyces boomerangus]|uniref:RING-type domain-containing protein n=1 Tax=Furculomyces boomerangus TaxID=61424 RepID=A0A2T9YBV6_9FUNG|nr:hypothetical protein BB559_004935 [Furculomyces boomerangus]